jgi:hypothetical protein
MARERRELETDPEANIYMDRGLIPTVAVQVARQLMAKDALATHAGDELQAALTSALTFSIGVACR